jgi:hypothetical protein
MLTENVTQANEHTLLPVARTKDLVVNELPDEVLVYDLTRHKAHCLNQTAAQIWHLCNGQRTVPEIARILAQELDKAVDEEVVWLALDQLSKSRLLEQETARLDTTSRLSRRAAVRRLGLGAAIVLPGVITVVAPLAVQAATCGGCINLSGSNSCPSACAGVSGRCYPSSNSCAPPQSPAGTITCSACDALTPGGNRSWQV